MDTKELKKAGLKATLPRLRILEILETSSEKHMSAEDVYRALIAVGGRCRIGNYLQGINSI